MGGPLNIYLFSIFLSLTNFIDKYRLWLAFHKQQDLSQTSGAVNDIAE